MPLIKEVGSLTSAAVAGWLAGWRSAGVGDGELVEGVSPVLR